ncbi:hypothetical protein PSACC_00106 [Paramicrosporidium saccamoebae]|uniref:Uncharacterized protein n=1 Tax=Paramicrosporidium saccamoebae TaxID=1246581 RepID=A0A2H9TQS1_9FUNG|nr:hypothetical protein PSACC_00106 [Paramicrosporidium saccamoebae]
MSRWIAGYYPYYLHNQTQEYDQPELALEVLKYASKLNPGLELEGALAECSKDPKCARLHLAELFKRLDNSESRVFIFTDEVNALYSPLAYRDVDSKPLQMERMPVLKMLKELIQNPRHKLVAALCNDNPQLSLFDLRSELKASSVETLEYFNDHEVYSVLKYYQSLGHVSNEPFDSRFARKIRFVSGGCGSKILPAVYYNSVYQKDSARRPQ